jgi:hypothetical protein
MMAVHPQKMGTDDFPGSGLFGNPKKKPEPDLD